MWPPLPASSAANCAMPSTPEQLFGAVARNYASHRLTYPPAFFAAFAFVFAIIGLLVVVGMWKTFDKAGQPISGPPKDSNKPLPRYPLKVENGLLFIEVPLEALV